MYTGYGFNRWGIGDVDVVKNGDEYHLFHLVLPNHNYIAHAVSRDGLNWRRVENALFIGDPGRWDDDMLWTMHVTPDPDRPGHWRMFYTGLNRREQGRVQRVGLARSSDLIHWTKDGGDAYPLSLDGTDYENDPGDARHWVSFRDPFLYCEDQDRFLLASARVNRGPLVRRGCVVLLRETAPDRFRVDSPLHYPGLYDDIEVPGLLRIEDRYYLIGSIREDVKVHYWLSQDLLGPYGNLYDNVLLPQGNYAARFCRDGDRWLVWNFFFTQRGSDGNDNLLPPPKELLVDEDRRLRLRSFSGFDREVTERRAMPELGPLRKLLDNPSAKGDMDDMSCWFGCPHGFEAFLLGGEHDNFRMRCRLTMSGSGKCGVVLRLDEEGDGYFVSLDLIQGLAQIRAWGRNPHGDFENAFQYRPLQSASFAGGPNSGRDLELVAFGRYLELSIDGYIVLSLADDGYTTGRAGFYAESSRIRVEDLTLETMRAPRGEDYEIVM